MIYKNAFFANKDTGRSDYNFNLKELTENFSFLDFVFDVQRGEAKYYGGFVVCTPKQYIVGYNAKFGSGSHNASYARFIKDMQGGGKIFSDEDLLRLSNICKNKYIYAKL